MKLLTNTLLLCTLCATAWGDVVLDWNQAALEAVRARNIPPPRVARDLAILHLAIHDAVNSIARTHESYAFTGHVPAAASRQAAAATAGYHALTALFPHPEDQVNVCHTLRRSTLHDPGPSAQTHGHCGGHGCRRSHP
jgi:hypothetical protein